MRAINDHVKGSKPSVGICGVLVLTEAATLYG